MSEIPNIDPRVLGDRLKIARSNAGLTQEVVANELKLARTTLLSIEAGQRKVRPKELVGLAALYGTSVGHILSDDSVHFDLLTKFRKLENVQLDESAHAATALLNRLVSGAVELERALGASLRFDYPPPISLLAKSVTQQAEDAAVAFRNRLGVGLGRIDDLLSLLELDVGIRIFFRPIADSKISGLYAFDPAVGACMLVNSTHHWHRRVQTLAHETGHFVSDRSVADILDHHTFGLSVGEKFARRFGAALLMPAPSVRVRFDQLLVDRGSVDLRGLILLSHQFGVATEAMCRRLEDLDLLAEGTWRSIDERGYNSALEKAVLGDGPADTSPPKVSPRLAYLAASALETEMLSEGQLCEMLVVDRVELRQCIMPFQHAG